MLADKEANVKIYPNLMLRKCQNSKIVTMLLSYCVFHYAAEFLKKFCIFFVFNEIPARYLPFPKCPPASVLLCYTIFPKSSYAMVYSV